MNKKVLLTLFAVVTAMSVFAQGRMDLRINEIAVQSDSNYVDQNGNRAGWIEIFNASYATNGIEKMFITTLKPDFIQNYFKTEEQKSNKKRNQLLQELRDSRNGEIYEIPRGDVATKVKPRTHVVFTADVDTVAGTFHLPFALTPGQYVALYDVNGDLVDEVTIPGDLLPNQTYARCSEDKIDLHAEHKFNAEDWEVRDNTTIAKAITPGKFNSRPENENIQKFKDEDPSGILLTLMSMGVVFCALLLLYILFKLFGKAFAAKDKKKEEDVAIDKAVDNSTVEETQPAGDDEAIAAICMALYQHFNAHDEESGILTFDRSHQASSAWGSKGNLLRHQPEHRDFNH